MGMLLGKPETEIIPQRLLDLGLGLPIGIYANAGHPTEGLGWQADPAMAAERFAGRLRVLRAFGVAVGATLL